MPDANVPAPAIDVPALEEHLLGVRRLLNGILEGLTAAQLMALDGALGRGAGLRVETQVLPRMLVRVLVSDDEGDTVEIRKISLEEQRYDA